jgi:hypothetical protein
MPGLEGSLVEKEVCPEDDRSGESERQELVSEDPGALRGAAKFDSGGGVLRAFRPGWVVGVGGYASGPVVLAAWALGYKTFLQEQNVFPGLSNRILGRFVDRAFISFAESAGHFPAGKAVLTGNPVRRRILSGKGETAPHPFTLLIFGGSQGAHRLNQVMGTTLPLLKDLQKIGSFTRPEGFSGSPGGLSTGGSRPRLALYLGMDRVYGWRIWCCAARGRRPSLS